jgi:hypothetical protein
MAERKAAIRLPHIACEITSRGVAAVRSEGKPSMIGAMHSCALAAGVLTPALNAQNVQDARALSDALEQALTNVGGRNQDVIAVLPDSAVRVTLLDFDSLPEKHKEAEAAVRFRLRKSLPCDIEKPAMHNRLRRDCTWRRRLCCVACLRNTSRHSAPQAARREWCCLPAWEPWERWTRKVPP